MAKHRQIIAPDDVPTVFDDDRIHRLAKLGKLPANADLEKFAAGIREAARIFAHDARAPTDNELRREIEALWKASDRQCYAKAAELLEALSPRARAALSTGKKRRGPGRAQAQSRLRTAVARRVARPRTTR
jgi:hypothetical protein